VPARLFVAVGAVAARFSDAMRDILQRLFPTRRVVVFPALDLIWGLGAFHCITQQQPAL